MFLTNIKYRFKRLFKSSFNILLNDKDYRLRCRAIKDVNDTDELSYICFRVKDLRVKEKAFKKLPQKLQLENKQRLIDTISSAFDISHHEKKSTTNYNKGIVVFIDILGFRDTVYNADSDKILKILENR